MGKQQSFVSQDVVADTLRAVRPTKQLGQPVTLRIRVELENSRLRELSDYLALVDRLYGRIDPKGLRSYSQRDADQLRVIKTQAGSLELVLQQFLDFVQQQNLAILYILLWGLPNIARGLTEAGANTMQAYHDYEAGRLARIQRQEIEHRGQENEPPNALLQSTQRILEEHPALSTLPENDREDLAQFLAAVYRQESDAVRKLRAFIEENVRAELE